MFEAILEPIVSRLGRWTLSAIYSYIVAHVVDNQRSVTKRLVPSKIRTVDHQFSNIRDSWYASRNQQISAC